MSMASDVHVDAQREERPHDLLAVVGDHRDTPGAQRSGQRIEYRPVGEQAVAAVAQTVVAQIQAAVAQIEHRLPGRTDRVGRLGRQDQRDQRRTAGVAGPGGVHGDVAAAGRAAASSTARWPRPPRPQCRASPLGGCRARRSLPTPLRCSDGSPRLRLRPRGRDGYTGSSPPGCPKAPSRMSATIRFQMVRSSSSAKASRASSSFQPPRVNWSTWVSSGTSRTSGITSAFCEPAPRARPGSGAAWATGRPGGRTRCQGRRTR